MLLLRQATNEPDHTALFKMTETYRAGAEGQQKTEEQIAETRVRRRRKTGGKRRIEETGETSAYFKTSTDFLNYKTVNAVQFPFRIVHSTTEPGGAKEDLRVSKVIENGPVNPTAFSNPRADPKGR